MAFPNNNRGICAALAVTLASLLFGSQVAHAGLIGEQVQVETGYIVGGTPTIIDTQDVTVGSPDVELANYLGLFNLNIEDNTIGIQFLQPVDFSQIPVDFIGFGFFWDSLGPQLGGVSLIDSNISGFDASHVTLLDPTSLAVDFHGLNVALGDTGAPTGALIGLNFNSVPEPPTILLMMLGLVAFVSFSSRVGTQMPLRVSPPPM